MILDAGHALPAPDGILINGQGWNGYTFSVDQGALENDSNPNSKFYFLFFVTIFTTI